MLDPLPPTFSLGETLGLGSVDEDELYVALDWLGERQEAVEGRSRASICRRHAGALRRVVELSGGPLLQLAQRGYSRDGKKGKLQIVYGLLCAGDGCPVAIEAFEGNTADPRRSPTDRQGQGALRA